MTYKYNIGCYWVIIHTLPVWPLLKPPFWLGRGVVFGWQKTCGQREEQPLGTVGLPFESHVRQHCSVLKHVLPPHWKVAPVISIYCQFQFFPYDSKYYEMIIFVAVEWYVFLFQMYTLCNRTLGWRCCLIWSIDWDIDTNCIQKSLLHIRVCSNSIDSCRNQPCQWIFIRLVIIVITCLVESS